MDLLWLLYKGKKSTRYLLFLSLGSRSGKLVGLDTSKVSDAARKKIMDSKEFNSLSLDSKVRWLQRYCPEVMKTAYRELREGSIKSRREYQMNQR
jgi:hypothetical protein